MTVKAIPYPYTTTTKVGSSPCPFAVTPSDTDQLAYGIRGFYVGVTGDVTVCDPTNAPVLFKAVPAGAVIYVQTLQIKATGTTATNIVGLV